MRNFNEEQNYLASQYNSSSKHLPFSIRKRRILPIPKAEQDIGDKQLDEFIDMEDRLSLERVDLANQNTVRASNLPEVTLEESLSQLTDPQTFQKISAVSNIDEIQIVPDQNAKPEIELVMAWGKIHDRNVFLFGLHLQKSSSYIPVNILNKISNLYDLALQNQSPVIGLFKFCHMEKATLDQSYKFRNILFRKSLQASGSIPQISILHNINCNYKIDLPILSDFVIEICTEVSADEISLEDILFNNVSNNLARESATKVVSGRRSNRIRTDTQSYSDKLRHLLEYLPQNWEDSQNSSFKVKSPEPLEDLTPAVVENFDSNYEKIIKIFSSLLDVDSLFVFDENTKANPVFAFGRIQGRNVGLIANNSHPKQKVCTAESIESAAQFIRTCDCFNLPVISFLDFHSLDLRSLKFKAGFDKAIEKFAYAICDSTIPIYAVVTQNSRYSSIDLRTIKTWGFKQCFAWDNSENINQAEREKAIEKIKGLKEMFDQEREFEETFLTISPGETRTELINILSEYETKPVYLPIKKHGNHVF